MEIPHETSAESTIASRVSKSFAELFFLGHELRRVSEHLLDRVPAQFLAKELGVRTALVALVVKGYKTYRSLELLVSMGYENGAGILLRVLMEAAAHVSYIAGDPTQQEERGNQYVLYTVFEDDRLRREMDDNSKLKGLLAAEVSTLIQERVVEFTREFGEGERQRWMEKLFGISVEQEMAAIGFDAVYDLVYRWESRAVHARDWLDQVTPREGGFFIRLHPQDQSPFVYLSMGLVMFLMILDGCSKGLGNLVDGEVEALSKVFQKLVGAEAEEGGR